MSQIQLSPTDQAKLLIGAISLVPYVLVLALFLIPMYVACKRPMLGASWKDALMWVSSIFVYYGISVGLMYVPWPGIPVNDASSTTI